MRAVHDRDRNRFAAAIGLWVSVALLLSCCTSASPTPAARALPTASPSLPPPPAAPSPAPTVLPPTVAQPTVTFVPPTATPVGPTPIPTLARKGPGVILVSVDGAPADVIAGYIADGTMPVLAKLAQDGAHARYALSINPTLTAAAQTSIATGSLPRRTGIVSNRFHLPQDDFYWYQDGFSVPVTGAEPVWKTAQKAGLRTAAVFFVGGQPDLPKQMADYTVGYGKADIHSNRIDVRLAQAAGWEASPKSASALLQGTVPIVSRGNTIATLMLLATDTIDNGAADYDTFYLCEKAAVTPDCAVLKSDGSWGSFVLNRRIMSGADFKITEVRPDGVRLFQSAVNYNAIAPADLLRAINARFGFFPASPDYYALENGWITPEDYLHMVQRLSSYQMDVAQWIWDTYAPDLMFTYQAPIDESMHQFMLIGPDQPGYTPERAKIFEGYRRAAARIVDDNLGRLLDAVDLKTTTIFVVSDHGMAPIHAQVNVNAILAQGGWLKLYEGKSDVDVPHTRAIAFTSGAAGHIYINVKGREAAGVVPASDVPALVAQITATLRSVADPKTGQPVFSRLVGREGLAELGLDTPASGDIFVQAVPGYALEDTRGATEIFSPVQYFGQHGQDPTLEPLHAIFYAAGRGIKPGTLEPVRLIDVAPTIARLLGFQPAPTVDGKMIEGVLR